MESLPNDVAARADRFINRVRGIEGDVLAFSSGHIIRMIAARWLGLPPADGRFFYCRPASVGVLGYEHNCHDEPIIRAGITSDCRGSNAWPAHFQASRAWFRRANAMRQRRPRFGTLPGLRFCSVEQSKDSGRRGASQEVCDEKNPEIRPRR